MSDNSGFQQVRQQLQVNGKTYEYYSLPSAAANGLGDISRLPYSLKVLLENLLRHQASSAVSDEDISAMADWLKEKRSSREIAYHPARVLMQDFTGVPAVVDLAAMRDAMVKLGGSAAKINPLSPVDLVIDHSVQVDSFAKRDAFHINVETEMARNHERYSFLRWGQDAFDNFKVVPPGTGICHQVNLEYLAKAVWTQQSGDNTLAYPDTLVGTDSHTTMVNGLGVLGWGVGGIEAEAAILGQPISMLIPEVVGFRLHGQLNEGVTATDLVLTVVQMLRQHGVVGKFVEFYGAGLDHLPLADRATIANMAPEYGATCGFFPIDRETLAYLQLSGRPQESIELVEAYCRAQGLWREADVAEPEFTSTLSLDLSTVKPSVAGPKRPQDKVELADLPQAFAKFLQDNGKGDEQDKQFSADDVDYSLGHGAIVIAAITSCTNTSNPAVMLSAGLVAKKAREKGLRVKPWVKTSLAPGSKVVTDYLAKAGLQDDLDHLGFNLVGYGCTTCIGNSGPLPDELNKLVSSHDIAACAVLSGNRNFEGRIHPLVKANWLASPPLVVAYALAGSTTIDITSAPLGSDSDGEPVYLADIWPSNAEVSQAMASVSRDMFQREYADVFAGTKEWQDIAITPSETYQWQADSTYIQHPPFFAEMTQEPAPLTDINGARILALLGDSVTTDHISPAGAIKADSPAGEYLSAHGVKPVEFNSYGSRRGNHEVMMRGTFANIRIRNEMVPGVEGGFTRHIPSGETLAIYDAAMKYQAEQTPLVVVAGKEYGTGSSRDWAAKGTLLLGVKAVITESFERIHRSNLIGMGVLPLQFTNGQTRKSLALTGEEVIDIHGIAQDLQPQGEVQATIHYQDGSNQQITLKCRIDTADELAYYQHGGILQYVLRNIAQQ